MKRPARRSGAAALALAATLAVAAPARAVSVVALSGVDVSAYSLYGYFGGIATINDDPSRSGPLVRLWWDRLTYHFAAAPGRVDASSVGESASVGWQQAYPSGMISGYAGVDERETSLSPGIPSRTAGAQTGGRYELDLDQRLCSAWRLDGIGSFVTGTKDYWARGQALYALGGGVSAGPEAIWMGNPDYDADRFGVTLVGIPVYKSVKAGLEVGYAKTVNLPGGAYGSVGLAASF